METGCFFPSRKQSTFFAMGGDDCSLHFDLNDLTARQKLDHKTNVELTALLQVALLAIGKTSDFVALYDTFRQERWASLLERYYRHFKDCGLETVPATHIVFAPPHGFYDALSETLPEADLTSLYMISGSNAPLHASRAALETSRNVNSKFHFANHAPKFGLNTPQTLETTKSDLSGQKVAEFLYRYRAADGQIMLKIQGLAGARNVTSVASAEEATAYVEAFADEFPVLLQEKLDLSLYTEMTVDLFVSDNDVHISNIRKILFADGLWVGNHASPDHRLTPEQEGALIQVGEYARAHGHSNAHGTNCGVDYFVGPNGEIVITEINARWTGGLFPMQLAQRLPTKTQEAVICIDVVPVDQLDAFLDFIQDHLPSAPNAQFSAISFGFSSFVQETFEKPSIFVWLMVFGDFSAFVRSKSQALHPLSLPTVDKIVL